MSDYLKTFSEFVIEVKNMTLKNKVLLDGWVSTAAKVFRYDKMCGKKIIYLIWRLDVEGMWDEKNKQFIIIKIYTS